MIIHTDHNCIRLFGQCAHNAAVCIIVAQVQASAVGIQHHSHGLIRDTRIVQTAGDLSIRAFNLHLNHLCRNRSAIIPKYAFVHVVLEIIAGGGVLLIPLADMCNNFCHFRCNQFRPIRFVFMHNDRSFIN